MTEKKAIKLSASQKDVIRLMREGYRLKWEGNPVLCKEYNFSLRVGLSTARSLYNNKLIHQPSTDYYLTDLGKTIAL